ncbi:MAG: MFS transporter, partial [Dehalococcoidia bacterium]|nr:MFS transporter [Dehalococcoidia bacterium]
MSEETRPKRTAVGAWITYDIANTVFWTGVVGLSFPLWLTKELSGDDATLGYTLAAAMTVVLVAAPILGAISDQIGRKMPLLVASTLICIVATLLLGNGGMFISLALFALALASMELGTIFYNSLLHEVSTEGNRGMISGLGTGIGYLGSFIAVGVALGFTDSRGYVFVMQVVAFLFLLFALPIFILLNEQRRQVLSSTALIQVKQAFSQLGSNLRRIHRFPGLRRFLVARFLYGMGVNTGVAFAVVYASETIGLSDREIQLILLAGISIAIPCGVLWGALADRIGPSRVLTISLFLWMGLFLFAVAIPWLSWPKDLYWAVGFFTGVAISGVWTADRPYMLAFTPPQYLGEFFGLHGMVGKLGRVIGPFMWAFIAATLG